MWSSEQVTRSSPPLPSERSDLPAVGATIFDQMVGERWPDGAPFVELTSWSDSPKPPPTGDAAHQPPLQAEKLPPPRQAVWITPEELALNPTLITAATDETIAATSGGHTKSAAAGIEGGPSACDKEAQLTTPNLRGTPPILSYEALMLIGAQARYAKPAYRPWDVAISGHDVSPTYIVPPDKERAAQERRGEYGAFHAGILRGRTAVAAARASEQDLQEAHRPDPTAVFAQALDTQTGAAEELLPLPPPGDEPGRYDLQSLTLRKINFDTGTISGFRPAAPLEAPQEQTEEVDTAALLAEEPNHHGGESDDPPELPISGTDVAVEEPADADVTHHLNRTGLGQFVTGTFSRLPKTLHLRHFGLPRRPRSV